MHRVIFQTGNEEIDHKDGDGLNNQRYNLRDATRLQNSYNQKKRTDNTSNYKGVVLKIDKFRIKPWIARIYVNKQQIYLGYYATAEEAALAYD